MISQLLLIAILFVGSSCLGDTWKLEIEQSSDDTLTSLNWVSDTQNKVPATDPLLFQKIRNKPNQVKSVPEAAHSAVIIPFNDSTFPLGEVVILRPGQTARIPRPNEKILGFAPRDLHLTRQGFFYTHKLGRNFIIEHYNISNNSSEKLHELDSASVGSIYEVELTLDAVKVSNAGKIQEYRPGGLRGDASTSYQPLGPANIDVLEGTFGGSNLTQKAKDGFLSPAFEEEATAVSIANNIRRNRNQKSVIVWGPEGTDTQGIIHLFVQKIVASKQDETTFGWFKDWQVFELKWSSFNTEGLVDLATNKATQVCRAARRKKVIIFIDQIEKLVGLGVNGGDQSDAASAFLSDIKSGEVILVGTTSSTGIAYLRGRRDFFNAFTEIKLNAASPEGLLIKLKNYASKKSQDSGVDFPEPVLQKIIELTNRFQPEKGQPQKSFDAIDALASQYAMVEDGIPTKVEITSEMFEGWLSQTTGIKTVSQAGMEELVKFLNDKGPNGYEAKMASELTGQTAAISALKKALLRIAYLPKKTNAEGQEIGAESLLLTGPSGTGKTMSLEVFAKAAKEINLPFPIEPPLEGSTLTNGEQAVNTLLGAAPGYIGFDPSGEGGILFQMVKRSPQSVIIFEEFDKMHEQVDQAIMSLIDAGTVQNRSGKVAKFSRGLLVFTANFGVVGSGGGTTRNALGGGADASILCDLIDRWDRHHLFPEDDPLHVTDPEVAKWDRDRLRQELYKCLNKTGLVNPQVLGRIGESNIVIFHHFTKSQIAEIRDKELPKIANTFLKQPFEVGSVTFTPELKEWLLNTAWGEDGKTVFYGGARVLISLLKDKIQSTFVTFFTENAFEGRNLKGTHWKVDVEENNGVKSVKIILTNPPEQTELGKNSAADKTQ